MKKYALPVHCRRCIEGFFMLLFYIFIKQEKLQVLGNQSGRYNFNFDLILIFQNPTSVNRKAEFQKKSSLFPLLKCIGLFLAGSRCYCRPLDGGGELPLLLVERLI